VFENFEVDKGVINRGGQIRAIKVDAGGTATVDVNPGQWLGGEEGKATQMDIIWSSSGWVEEVRKR
jgi:Tfp pilus assembly protein PilP